MWSIWIKSYSSLKDSIKTKRVARRLNITVPQVIGHLHMLWWWVMEQVETGDISHVEAWEVEEVMGWNGQEGALFSALIEFGFIDDDGQMRRIHDWQDYSGSVLAQRDKNREKLTRFRERQKQQSSNETVTKRLRNGYETNDETVTKRLHDGYETVAKRDREEKSKVREDYTPPTPPMGGAGGGDTSAPAAEETIPPEQKEGGGTATLTQLIAAWNEQLVPLGFHAADKATPGREKAFRARVAERAERRKIGWWRDRIAQLASSPYMRQAAKDGKDWLRVDWLLKEDNLVKVYEGRYSKQRTPSRDDPNKAIREAQTYEEAAAAYYASL